MSISGWYESLPRRQDVCALLPMQWQSALPLPVLREGKLWLYVPFQRVWAQENALCCSPALAEMWFFGPGKRIGLFCDLKSTRGADECALLDRVELGESAIYRSNLALRKYLSELDALEREMDRNGKPAPGQMERCGELLQQALLIPGQRALYEGMR